MKVRMSLKVTRKRKVDEDDENRRSKRESEFEDVCM